MAFSNMKRDAVARCAMRNIPLCLWTGIILVYLLALGACSVEPVDTEIMFEDATAEAGLGMFRHYNGGVGEAWAPEIVGGGGGFLDYDGDGWIDILLISGGRFRGQGSQHSLMLFRNNADGSFTDVTEAVGLAGISTYAFGLTSGDYDNDGDVDVVVTTLYEDLFLRNEGARFVESAAAVGIGTASEWSTSAMFFDADKDGFLDLYIATYVEWSPDTDQYCGFEGQKVYCTPELYDGIHGRYYHNDGDGTFTEKTDSAGFLTGIEANRNKALGVAELDANADDWPDIIIANDTERDLLYLNNGDGSFREDGMRSGIAVDEHGQPRAGMGIDVGVVDSTGQPTVFVGNFSNEMVGVYRRGSRQLFTDRAARSQIGRASRSTLTFGLVLFDVDLDADLDLFVANGHVQTHIAKIVDGVSFRQQPQLFLNRGDGIFDEFEATGIMATALVARAAAYADYDRDGDLDLLVVENNGPAHLWRNVSSPRAFLGVKLLGNQSNRDGYGATVEVSARGLTQVRRVRSGSSFLAMSETTAMFGLGNAEQVDSVRVRWPSGVVDRTSALAPNQMLIVDEGIGFRDDTQ